LIQRQYRDDSTAVTPGVEMAWQYLECSLSVMHLKEVAFRHPEPPVIVYSDAMFVPGQPMGLGAIVFSPRSPRPVGLFTEVPEELTQQLLPKKTHIGQGEALAGLLGPIHVPELYENAFVIHFVDNTSALSGLIKGVCPKADTAAIVALYTLYVASLCAGTNT